MPAQNFIPKIDSARALAMYDEGASDREIGAACGTSSSGVCYWRKRHGLARVAHNDNRLTDAQIRRAKNMLRGGATKAQIAAHLGVSKAAIQTIRRSMDDVRLRRSGISNAHFAAAVLGDKELPRRIEKAIGLRVPTDIRMDAVNEMYLDLLEGKLPVDQVESAASRYRNRAFELNGFNHSVRSIDEEDENGRSIADTLVDPMSVRPFEEILERRFANDD